MLFRQSDMIMSCFCYWATPHGINSPERGGVGRSGYSTTSCPCLGAILLSKLYAVQSLMIVNQACFSIIGEVAHLSCSILFHSR